MYIPPANEEQRLPVIRALMAAHPLATLVTMGAAGLYASHIPMLLEEDGSEFGVLRCHVARANMQWREFAAGVDALAIFQGPEHYISPSWYAEKREHGKVVPTWNYAVVHAYGPLKAIEDGRWLLAHVERLVNVHEGQFAAPWKVDDAPADYVERQIRGIVGIEMPIRRLQGKWKVSQNRSERDRVGVAQGLAKLGTAESLAMKALVEEK